MHAPALKAFLILLHVGKTLKAWKLSSRQVSLKSVCVTGFDASAHMVEETVGARSTAPAAIIMSLGASYVIGLLLITVLLFCVQVRD